MLAFRPNGGFKGDEALVVKCDFVDWGVATGVESAELYSGEGLGGNGSGPFCGFRTSGCGRFFRMIRGGGIGKNEAKLGSDGLGTALPGNGGSGLSQLCGYCVSGRRCGVERVLVRYRRA